MFHTQKPQTDCAKNRTFRSLLRAVEMISQLQCQILHLFFNISYAVKNNCPSTIYCSLLEVCRFHRVTLPGVIVFVCFVGHIAKHLHDANNGYLRLTAVFPAVGKPVLDLPVPWPWVGCIWGCVTAGLVPKHSHYNVTGGNRMKNKFSAPFCSNFLSEKPSCPLLSGGVSLCVSQICWKWSYNLRYV